MFDLSRRQRLVMVVLLVMFGVGGVVLVARQMTLGDVVVAPGPSEPAGGERAEAAERDGAGKGEPATDVQAKSAVTVHVCGAVASPGVYTLPSGSRVADAVRLAGGLAAGAWPEQVNMAKVLSDSSQVYIPTRPKTEPGAGPGPGSGFEGACAEPSRMAEAVYSRVNINTAGLAELESLPGIGPTLARRIIDYRGANGRFENPEQLTDVPGIGQAKFEALKDLITVY
ncbi:MAG: helix-hairpin-helix domain-containing protein [Firmicutes bacterium]|nr:helix-hairpin-helix domain-containing protein [Bacillota bacterium]MDH7494993.1 helix-hairpin-helix domain-containing protein [Bacillota bacterium]